MPHSTDAMVKTAMAHANTVRAPKRSDSQALAGMKIATVIRYEEMPVETATGVVPKLAAICGMAGEMMVASRISMNSAEAAISAISVGLRDGSGAGFWADGAGAGAAWSVPADWAGRVTIQLRGDFCASAPMVLGQAIAGFRRYRSRRCAWVAVI